jgi:serine phosphatase RsbU (regulator of sigma subunit)
MKEKLSIYLQEFNQARLGVIKSRLKLFSIIAPIIYIAASLLSTITNPSEFKPIELTTWIFLIASSIFVLAINKKTKTLRGAKSDAFLFISLLTVVLVAIFFIYPQYVVNGFGVFMVSLFCATFIIPWEVKEVILIGILNFLGYSATFLWLRQSFPPQVYIEGLIYLAVTLSACIIIRRRDDEREKENFVLMKELEKRYGQMQRELMLARQVHDTLIPKSKSTANADIAVSYIPVSTVGGDYATFHETTEGNLSFLIGDVTGHGVPAALLVNRLYGEVEALFTSSRGPGKLLNELDRFVNEHFKLTDMYMSVCCGLIDFKQKKLFYSNYGHPAQILFQHKDNKICLLESQTYFLGIRTDSDTSQIFEGAIDFGHKDRIILFTDGIIEAKDKTNQLYGIEKLKAFAQGHRNELPNEFNRNLLKEIKLFSSGSIADDLFFLTIDVK